MSEKISIGLTGGIGSGKSTVAKLFAEYDIEIIDTDIIAREVVAPGQPVLQDIALYFGEQALLDDGNLNRAFVRQQTFSDNDKKSWLNATLHPLIRKSMLNKMQASTSAYCIVDVPLLTENGMANLFNKVLVVDCAIDKQIERASKRDNSDLAGIKAIIAAQASREQRKAIADNIINNDGSLQSLALQVKNLHQHYLSI